MASDTTQTLQTEPSFQELMGADIVELYVGPEEELFRVHEEILCNKVPYFDKMFREGFLEAKSKMATFPEDTVQSFDVLLGWVYYGKVRELWNAGYPSWTWSPADAYKLADKLCLTVLKDTIMDAFIKSLKLNHELPSVSLMSETLMTLEGSNPMRNFIEQTFRFVLSENSGSMSKEWNIKALNSLLIEHPDFSHNILTAISKNVAVSDPTAMSACHFHCHEEGECHLGNN